MGQYYYSIYCFFSLASKSLCELNQTEAELYHPLTYVIMFCVSHLPWWFLWFTNHECRDPCPHYCPWCGWRMPTLGSRRCRPTPGRSLWGSAVEVEYKMITLELVLKKRIQYNTDTKEQSTHETDCTMYKGSAKCVLRGVWLKAFEALMPWYPALRPKYLDSLVVTAY